MYSKLMRLREIDFINRFWSMVSGHRVVKEFFQLLISRRIALINRFLQEHGNISPERISYCHYIIQKLISLERACLNNLAVFGCHAPGCSRCLSTYIEQYTALVTACYHNVMCHYNLPGVPDEETTRTLMASIRENRQVTSNNKETAIQLVLHYLDYLKQIDEIIVHLMSTGHHVGITRQAVYNVITELQSIYARFRCPPVTVNQTMPEARKSAYLCIIMVQFHVLIEELMSELVRYN